MSRVWPVWLVNVGITVLCVRPAGQVTEFSSQLEVDTWKSPRSGWLYVVDPEFKNDRVESRIWLFDPNRGRIMGTIRAGSGPDIAISQSGDRLYIASTMLGCGRGNCDELTVIDTGGGSVLSIAEIPGRVQYKVYPWSSTMTVSADGRSVYVLKSRFTPSGDDAPYGLAVLDTALGRFLSEEIDLGQCGYGSFVSAPSLSQFVFHCPASNELRVYRFLTPSKVVLETAVAIPWGRRLHARHIYSDVPAREFITSSNRNEITAVSGDGTIYKIDLTAHTVAPTAVSGNPNVTVSPLDWPASADRKRLYVGVGPYDGEGMSDEIRVFDSRTWQQVGSIHTSTRFWNAVASRDGSIIYALTADHGSILAIDNARARELRAMPLGRAPSLALVAP